MSYKYSKYVLILLIGSVVVASGCTSESTTNPKNDSSNDAPEQSEARSSDNSGEGSGSADIALSSFNVPEEVEMGENFTVEATFENIGGESGDFETTVMMREQNENSFSATDNIIKGEILPGEEKAFTTTLKASGVSSNVVGLAGTDAESNLRIVPKRISIGEEYKTTNDIGITVKSVKMADYFRYEDIYGEESIQEPEEGQYVFVNLKTQNQGSTPKSLPLEMDFQIIANNRQYEPTSYLTNEPIDKGDKYDGGEVQPGIVREGYIMFEVPEDVSKDDVSVVWNEVISLTEKSVYWAIE